ncbi:hypothetical protein R5H32_01185 [Defluviimonas sp. D31]|uniref:hypothetical protein n=1 Tax=Defluviimonas sp. D31 TaxID=3083253 RepID=UPI00296F7EE4|nr:hypothetical protein [Defluviimonas sp. D31]MDW4547955.1 hypothetical protein [Defluviimonas sp. D31]
MKRPSPPRFLARRSYRRRRLIDAARLLPVLGFILIMVPILWRPGATAAPDTALGGLYLFAVWFGLIGAAFLVARILARGEPDAGDGETERETR